MTKVLRQSSDLLEILGEHDSILQFRDLSSAVSFLRLLGNDPSRMAILRNIAAEHGRDIYRLNAEQVFRYVGSLLVNGRIRILRSVRFGRSAPQRSSQEEPVRQAAAQDPAPRGDKAGWIEINLRDEDGQPVKGQRYMIRLPDASVRDGTLDDQGHAEYYEINQGTCQVSFPGLEDEEWELA